MSCLFDQFNGFFSQDNQSIVESNLMALEIIPQTC